MALYSSKVIWDQHKEPALSAPLVAFTNQQQDTIELPFALPETVREYSNEDIIAIAQAAEIIDEMDGKPLYEKLANTVGEKNFTIIINAVDDEPYLSNKLNPLLAFREEVVGGIELCQKISGTPDDEVHIMVYRHLGEIESNIPSFIDAYKVTRLGGGYPARPSVLQLRQFRQRPMLQIGVGALIHLYRAVYFLQRQTTTFITVHGNAVANPMNLEVSFDMTVTQVLERCGLITPPTRVVLGGPLTGIAVVDTDRTRMTPATTAVLALVRNRQEFRYACIGCGRCERACPQGLNPMYIYRFVNSGATKKLTYYDPQHCIECGMCSYVCPSRLPVAVRVVEAKQMINEGIVSPPVPEFTWQQMKEGLQRTGAAIGRGIAAILRMMKKGAVATGRLLVKGGKGIAKGAALLAAAIGKGAQRLKEKAEQGAAVRQEKKAAMEATVEAAKETSKVPSVSEASSSEKEKRESSSKKAEAPGKSIATPEDSPEKHTKDTSAAVEDSIITIEEEEPREV